jgi:hypothetical protein
MGTGRQGGHSAGDFLERVVQTDTIPPTEIIQLTSRFDSISRWFERFLPSALTSQRRLPQQFAFVATVVRHRAEADDLGSGYRLLEFFHMGGGEVRV